MVQPSAWTRCCPARPGRPSSRHGAAEQATRFVIPLALWSAPIDFPRATPQPAVDGPLAGWPRVRARRDGGSLAGWPMDLRADVLPEVMEPVRAPQAARSRSPRLPPHPHQAAPFSPGARCALDQVDADSSRDAATRDTRPAQLHRRVAPPRKGCPTEPTGPTRRSMVSTRCTRWTARGRWGVQDRPGGKGGAIGGCGWLPLR